MNSVVCASTSSGVWPISGLIAMVTIRSTRWPATSVPPTAFASATVMLMARRSGPSGSNSCAGLEDREGLSLGRRREHVAGHQLAGRDGNADDAAEDLVERGEGGLVRRVGRDRADAHVPLLDGLARRDLAGRDDDVAHLDGGVGGEAARLEGHEDGRRDQERDDDADADVDLGSAAVLVGVFEFHEKVRS